MRDLNFRSLQASFFLALAVGRKPTVEFGSGKGGLSLVENGQAVAGIRVSRGGGCLSLYIHIGTFSQQLIIPPPALDRDVEY